MKLSIKGVAVESIRAIPSQWMLADVDTGSKHRKIIRIEASRPDVLSTLRAVATDDPSLVARYAIESSRSARLELFADLTTRPSGDYSARVDVHFNHPAIKLLSVNVIARVRSPVKIVPRVLFCDAIDTSFKQSVRIEATDDSAFTLRSVRTPAGLSAEWQAGEARPLHIVALSRAPADIMVATGPHRVLFITDDERIGTVSIPVIVRKSK